MLFPNLNNNFYSQINYSWGDGFRPGNFPQRSSLTTDPFDIVDDIPGYQFNPKGYPTAYGDARSSISRFDFFAEWFMNGDISTLRETIDKYIAQLLEWVSSVLTPFSSSQNSDQFDIDYDVPPVYQRKTSYPASNVPGGYPYFVEPPVSSAPPSSLPLVSAPGPVHSLGNSFDPNPQVGPLTPAEGRTMAVKVARQLMVDFPGMTKAQAAGIVGNLWHESAGMNANVNEFGSGPPDQTYGAPNSSQFGYGWAQWTGSRKWDYINFCKREGLDPRSPAANYAFLKHELKNGEADGTPSSLPYILATNTVDAAAYAFRQKYERATMPVDSERLKHARELYALL